LTGSGLARDTSRHVQLENGLRRARQRSGLKQGELASRAGISRQTLSALEAGRAQPSTAIALNLARALGCRMEELFWLRDGGDMIRAQLAAPRAERGAHSRAWLRAAGSPTRCGRTTRSPSSLRRTLC